MSNRRNAAAALLGLPVLAAAAPDIKGSILPESEEAARIISYTIYAEARGEPFKGKLAVASVINTRARLKMLSLHGVCLQDKQFSCWNNISSVPAFFSNSTNLQQADLKARSECYALSWLLISRQRRWEHLTHFYNPSISTPDWATLLKGRKMIGNHIFGYID